MSGVVESIVASSRAPLIQLTCEHASNVMPPGYSWPDGDRWLAPLHWAWDPGAAEVTRLLAERFGAPATLSRFSRLLVDPNRPLESDTLFRTTADGRNIVLNSPVSPIEAKRRIETLYKPFHAAVDAMVAATDTVIVSVHSFTPVYEGARRSVEVGVLHDRQPALGQALRQHLQADYDARDNEPWDGRDGLMFSAQSHADRYGRHAVELELRQDLCTDSAWRHTFVDRFERAIRAILRS